MDLDYLAQANTIIASVPSTTEQIFTMILQRKGAFNHCTEVD